MILPDEYAAQPSASSLNLDLIRKYTMPAPRYTSYPPATQFTDQLGAVRVEDAFKDDNQAGSGPLSLYFHLPFCETRCWYCGCNTVITKRHDAAAEYLDDLALEMKLVAQRTDRKRPVTQVHFGGGTPTFLPPDQLRRLGALFNEHFSIAKDCEISVELDPRRLKLDHIQALREIGATRASLGVQDTNRKVQLAINRYQPHSLNQQAMGWLRAEGFKSVNVDLIYGLPLQTPESFSKTIDDVLSLSPERLSVFSYAHVPWIKPAQRIFEDRGQLPTPEEKLAMFALAHERLTTAGYVDVGLDHFAKPDDELARAQRAGTLHRNFQGYSTHAGASLYGFGLSSISQTQQTYLQNHKTLIAYRTALAAGQLPIERGLRLTDEDQRRRTIIMHIMCDRGLDYKKLSTALGLDFAKVYGREIASLQDLAADGIIGLGTNGFSITPAGMPLLRVVATRFDATLKPAAGKHAQVI
ncbi:MAG: oxygen-independent coproporphyrinogen III oxidase [Verrucomicrobia bacterium]|nr:oxygen-independent coproporphyrinogen III oxidase [Verrucomicrobiota bacterium]